MDLSGSECRGAADSASVFRRSPEVGRRPRGCAPCCKRTFLRYVAHLHPRKNREFIGGSLSLILCDVLTVDAVRRPRQSLQTLAADFLLAVQTRAVRSVLDA